ncbi:MAG: dihydrofolate reductase [Pseudobdellovibrio sp.]
MKLTQIVAISNNFAIGKDNKLLWHFPDDLKYFKLKTIHKIMIMGRKTFESFGGRPLPKRVHIVISRQGHTSQDEMVYYVKSLTEAYQTAEKLIAEHHLSEEVYIIGGAEIYKQSILDCSQLLITKIPGHYDADTFYPSDYSKHFTLLNELKSDTTPEIVWQTWVKT